MYAVHLSAAEKKVFLNLQVAKQVQCTFLELIKQIIVTSSVSCGKAVVQEVCTSMFTIYVLCCISFFSLVYAWLEQSGTAISKLPPPVL